MGHTVCVSTKPGQRNSPRFKNRIFLPSPAASCSIPKRAHTLKTSSLHATFSSTWTILLGQIPRSSTVSTSVQTASFFFGGVGRAHAAKRQRKGRGSLQSGVTIDNDKCSREVFDVGFGEGVSEAAGNGKERLRGTRQKRKGSD
jgi:hypothetical protein